MNVENLYDNQGSSEFRLASGQVIERRETRKLT